MFAGHESWSDDDPWGAFGEGDGLSGESGGGRGGRDDADPLRGDRRPGTEQATGGGPPVWLLAVAGVVSGAGLAAAVWPGVAVGRLLAAWFVCGFVVLGLLVTFTWLDVRRRAQFHYPGRPDLSLVRAVVLLVSVGGVAVAAVRVSVLVGHYGWSVLWS
jgi:hypothetical protein